MALDVGDKYVGIAISDTLRMIASPYMLYERKSFAKDSAFFKLHSEKEAVKGMIIGIPLNLSGEYGSQSQKTIIFAEKIDQTVDLPIIFWDERFSTQAVDKMMIAMNTSRKKREQRLDTLSATYILQGALDYLSSKV